ncbi:MAG: DUF1616 domain-containing protein [Candidatus Bathyarchaeia archaeon]
MSWIFDEEVLAVIAALLIVSGVFAAVQVLNAGRVVEPFSELGLLGPSGKIADYPRTVEAGQPFRLNVYVGNHEGRIMYYRVLVKVGDRNSTVNATTPLASEPIMELRTILAHNASEIIPADIVLGGPKTNLRLVFELWVYNETLKGFSYHGRWNQLWLNVTGGAEQPTLMAELSPEVEAALLNAYLAARRAEVNGGDVSGMVALLRRALFSAMAGEADEACKLASMVVSMEPEVSRMGIEAGRLRLFMGLGALAAIVASGVGGYFYLRDRFWVYLARVYGRWRLKWKGSGEDGGLSSVEKAVQQAVKAKDEVSLESLISSGNMGYKPSQLARAVFTLARRGAIELVDSNPPRSFGAYLASIHNLGFMVAAGLVALCILTVYLSNVLPALSAFRIALGSIFVLFLPGYSLVEALYPRGEELSPLERLALSIGLSLALVPLIGLVLNYTPWGIRLNPIMVSLSLLTLGLLLISAYRKYRIKCEAYR